MLKWGVVAGGLVACLVILAGLAGGVQAAGHTTLGCSSCHQPHHAGLATDAAASWGVPLWNTANTVDGLPTFTLYDSDTFHALATDIGQPDGASKLCLGCHDGSYIYFRTNSTSPFIIGAADLARMHPVSFTYDSSLASRHPKHSLYDPALTNSGLGRTIQADLLDSHGKMQCTSCHDVHTSGLTDYMLRYPYAVGTTDKTMCIVCHNK
jgi:predicted CXXCH cytochrome family protein